MPLRPYKHPYHKELITRLHPDKGGSSYLSARINEARDIIMNEKMKRN